MASLWQIALGRRKFAAKSWDSRPPPALPNQRGRRGPGRLQKKRYTLITVGDNPCTRGSKNGRTARGKKHFLNRRRLRHRPRDIVCPGARGGQVDDRRLCARRSRTNSQGDQAKRRDGGVRSRRYFGNGPGRDGGQQTVETYGRIDGAFNN